jgi:hypothetical protein
MARATPSVGRHAAVNISASSKAWPASTTELEPRHAPAFPIRSLSSACSPPGVALRAIPNRHIMLAALPWRCARVHACADASRAASSNHNERKIEMTLSMYQASVPVFVRGLTNLSAILKKAQDHAAAKNIEPSVLLACRLYPDMHPLVRQVQIASDSAKFCISRLAGIEPPKFEDTEATFDELYARIDKTIAFLKGIDATQIEGTESRPVTLTMRTGNIEFEGMNYLLHFALPNFFFHTTTAYDILRHNGVELGKFDYLGRPRSN